MNCTNLIELNLGFNCLGGNISELKFSKLDQLIKLDLLNNYFSGVMPKSLYSCKSLKAVCLSGNDLEEQIQPEIVLLKYLSFLSIGRNKLTIVTGTIHILMYLESLRVVALPNSFLGEELPDDDAMIGSGFQNIHLLGLSNCQLRGHISVWMSKLKKLEVLDLSANKLTGSIPHWLGSLLSLFFICLENNSLSGGLPNELFSLQALVSEKPYAQTDSGDVELPIYRKNTKKSVVALQYNYLSNFPPTIYIRNNSLSGNVPIKIGRLQNLHLLDLSINNIDGSIPDEVSKLTNLESLNLSSNHLSGSIPASLSSLHFLGSFSVAYSNLQGQVLLGTQLQGFDATTYEGNPGLYGSPFPTNANR
ncbi:receptor-like protein 2 [Malus sylvestris]|uniref:receptor-like protein 2 n=1 Tax=Malus sylvestris TaxID=3752 RepID=UPI0021ABA8FB|nr:receptor-like protein 2 [Malus sylvestris]